MNKPKLNLSRAGVRVYYSHADKGHWVDSPGFKQFVKTRKNALDVFEERIRYEFRRSLYAV
jgi:hypothetical protein